MDRLKSLLRKVYDAWMRFGHAVALIQTRIILVLMFYVVFTPVALLMRILRFDPLNRNFREDIRTYRSPRQARSPSHMKHQF